jgi:LEA14-like dessication related protein
MGVMRTLLAVAALAVAACSHAPKLPPPAPIPVELPLISLEAAKVEGLGFSGANLSFRGRIENPNATPISVLRVDYALDLEGTRAAQGSVPHPLAIAPMTPEGARGIGTVQLPVQLRFAAVPGIARVLHAAGEAAYVLSGTVVFLTPAGELGVPLVQTGRIVVPRAPQFHVEKVLLRSASPREVALEMRIDVRNPNEFSIPAGRVGCGLLLSDREVVRADALIPEVVGGGTAGVVVPIKISVFKAGKAAARLLIPFSSLDVAVKGEAVFGGVPVPLDLSTNILPGT